MKLYRINRGDLVLLRHTGCSAVRDAFVYICLIKTKGA